MNKFLLTEKDIVKLLIMMVLAAGFFGLAGLVSMILMQWITRQNFAEDIVDKHGIGEVAASRLGGAVVFCHQCDVHVDGRHIWGETRAAGPLGIPLYAWIGTWGCAALGLVEDIRNDVLKPRYRLLSKALIFLIVLGLWPDLVPKEIGIPGIDFLTRLLSDWPYYYHYILCWLFECRKYGGWRQWAYVGCLFCCIPYLLPGIRRAGFCDLDV